MIRYFYYIFLLFSFLGANESNTTKEVYFFGDRGFDDSTLVEAIDAKGKSFWEFYKDNNITIKSEIIPSISQSLSSFYKYHGYYASEFSIKESDKKVNITIQKNKSVRITDINITSDFNITELISFKIGDNFDSKKFAKIKQEIINKLLKNGYCSYELSTKAYVDLEKFSVELVYAIEKRGICVFDNVQIGGLKSIGKRVILSRLYTKKGLQFNSNLVKESSDNLFKLNLFNEILIDASKKSDNKVLVEINVTENKKNYYGEIGLGFDTYIGKKIHGILSKNNFLGGGRKIDFNFAYSTQEQLTKLSYFQPAFSNIEDYYVDLFFRLGYSNLEYDGFREKKTQFNSYLEYQSHRLKLRLGFSIENIFITNVALKKNRVLTQAINSGNFNLAYPYINVIYDHRDDKIDPQFGYYLSYYAEFGGSLQDTPTPFFKMIAEARAIYTISKLTIATVFKVGAIDEMLESGIPESKYFFAGGVNSNRAYKYQSLGVITSVTQSSIFGASSMANLSIEANYPIDNLVDNLGVALFVDNTMLNENSYDFSGDIISSIGFGLRYKLNFGVAKFDFAFNRKDFFQNGFSFGIGQSF